MFTVNTVSSIDELEQILAIQQKNLARNVDESEVKSQGFVTVIHDLDTLKQMHNLSPSVIAKQGDRVVGYALVMLPECRKIVPTLEPMFQNFERLHYQNRPLADYRFYVMGQVCIDKDYRQQGLFDKLYEKHREIHSGNFDFIMTEVATRNRRSMRAHERVGFQTLDVYRDELDEWAVILWNWS